METMKSSKIINQMKNFNIWKLLRALTVWFVSIFDQKKTVEFETKNYSFNCGRQPTINILWIVL